MIKKILLFIFAILLLGNSVHAQFPFISSYRGSTAPSTVFGGSSEAFLTAGRGIIPGPGNATFEDAEGDGYLRLTNNQTFQKGFIYNKTRFPSANGLKIEFEYYTYGGTGADGICFFLFDAKAGILNDPEQPGVTQEFQIGSFGGSLGYSQISIPEGSTGGVSLGYLGVGIDEYGNFATATEGRQGGVNALQKGSVSLRGKGNGANFFDTENYKYLTHVTTSATNGFELIPTGNNTRYPSVTNPNYRKLALDLRPLTNGGFALYVRITRGGVSPVTTTIIDNYQYPVAAPEFLKYGISGSTGASTNFHEIRNVRVDEYFSNTPVAADITLPACIGLPASINVAAQAQPTQIIAANTVDLQPGVNGIQNSVTIAGRGSATVNATGTVTFTPLNATVTGNVVIPYTINSTAGMVSATASLTVAIQPELVVLAGDDQTLNIGAGASTTIQLNGNTLTTGLNGIWTQVAGPAVAITNAASPTASIIGARAGNYTFRWTVNSAAGCQKFDDVNVVVQEIPIPKIGVTKVASSTTQVANGSFNITYNFNITNYGDVRLNDLSLVDDLATVFRGTTFSVVSKSIVGSSNLVINPNYNGNTDKELLSPSSFLEVGRSGQVTLQVNVLPIPTEGTFQNTATASGKSAFNGEVISKPSSNSVTPGPDLPASVTPVTLVIPKPKIGLNKVLLSAIQSSDGSYNIKYRFTISNFGDVRLRNVSLVDDLAAVFAGTTVTVVSKSVTRNNSLVINSAFNSTSNKDLLSAASTLEVGQSGEVELDINVRPTSTGTYNNTATAYGTSNITSQVVNKTSSNTQDTTNPDATPSVTPVTLTIPTPKIGLTKLLVSYTQIADGSYNIKYRFNISNFGEVRLRNVSLMDDLATVFAGATVSVTAKAVTRNSSLIINTGFNASNDKELLNSASSLEVGQSGEIELDINVRPTSSGVFYNTATAYGTSNLTNQVVNKESSNSQDSTNPDLPPSPTAVTLAVPPPIIGLSKSGTKKSLANGSSDIDFQFIVSNFGEVRLNNVSLIDDLEAVFAGTQFRVISIEKSGASTLEVNSAFNGTSNKELLSSNSYLNVGAEGRLILKINVLPLDKDGTFLNTATARGASAISNVVASKVSANSLTAGQFLGSSPTPIELQKTPILIPNGFSPNNDGINDKFVIKNTGNKRIHLEVYNRWANRVYKNSNYDNSWDGRCTEGIYLGEDVPPGTYYYIVKLDSKEQYTGYITINR